jgi:WD40 repeat protein
MVCTRKTKMTSALLLLAMTGQLQSSDERRESYLAHIFSAQASLEFGDTALTSRWLEKAPREHRGWEYDYLLASTDMCIASQKVDHDPSRIEASPDGKVVATSNLDGTITLYDADRMAQSGLLEGHTSQVWGLAFTPDSKQIVTTSRDTSVRLWDLEGREEIATLGHHPTTPYAVAVSPDGKWAVTPGWKMNPATNSPAGLVTVWDLKERKQFKQWMVTTHPIAAVAFSPDGSLCAVGCWEYQTIIYRTSDWSMVREIWPEESDTYKAVDWLQFSKDGKTILAAQKDQAARLYEVESGRMIAKYAGKGNATCARFTLDGKHVVTSWTDQNIRVYELDGKLVDTLRGHTNSVRSFALLSDSYVSIGEDGTMRTWWPYAARTAFDVGEACWSAVPSPDGALVATGGQGALVRIWTVEGEHVRDLAGFGALAVDVSWSPDGERLVSGSNDGTARVWSIKDGKLLFTFRMGTGQVRGVSWSRSGDLIATGQRTKLYVWNASDGSRIHEVDVSHGAHAVAFSPDGALVAAGNGGKISLIDAKSGSIMKTLEGAFPTTAEIAWSPDGRTLAAGSDSGEIGLWNAASGVKTHTIKEMTLGVWGLAFSPDGKRLAATGYDFTMRLFDVASGMQTFMVRDLPAMGFDVQWHPDGKRLIHADTDGRVTVYDARPLRDRFRGP